MRVGDADRALAAAHLRLRDRFTYPRQTAAALGTRGLVAVPPDPRGGELHLIGSTKCIHINRTILAPIFGIPLGALRLTEVDVGGGFGVRGELYPEDILVPLAAMKLGRPVRWIESRRENLMAANHAREVEYDVEIGFDGDGHILAIRALVRADIGAYVRTAALVPAEFGAELLRRLHYADARAEQAVINGLASGPRRGIGLAIYVEKTGLGPFETTHVAVRPDGRIVVDTGASSMGPGLETVLAQILGDALGLPTATFSVRHADTAMVESGVGTYGSRGTITAGNAAHLAAAKLIAEARQRAAARWGVPEADVKYARGVVEAGGRRVTLTELAAERRLAAAASFEVRKITYAGGAAAVVVDVDPETGAIKLVRVVVGADVGRAVNPALVDGQLVGGVAFGIGNTLHESLVYGADGQLQSGTFMDYALPAAPDVPPVNGFYQEVRATTNPLGLRGLGEVGNPGLGGAIANAVRDALPSGNLGH